MGLKALLTSAFCNSSPSFPQPRSRRRNMSSVEALKKPQTAYFLWFNANREKIQTMVGSKDFGTVGKKASELWKAAAAKEKAPFEAEVKRQKEAYDAFVATPAGQKALEEMKSQKKDEKQAKQDKDAEKAKLKEEKQIAREKRECKAAVKAVEKDEKLKKPLTSYFMWLNENRERITKMVGGKGGPEVTKKGSQMWKELSEKERKPFEDRAQKEKAAYEAYIATPEGAAALKAFKDATSAVAYKEKPAEEPEAEEVQEGSPKKAGQKRAADAAVKGGNAAAKKAKTAKAGA